MPYPVGTIPEGAWTALPDRAAMDRFTTAARSFWGVPDGAEIIAAPGASALIARLPGLLTGQRVRIEGPTYNEHAASFRGRRMDRCWRWRGRCQCQCPPEQPRWTAHGRGRNRPGRKHNHRRKLLRHVSRGISCRACSDARGRRPQELRQILGPRGPASRRDDRGAEMCRRMAEALGPWPVSGPALEIGARALEDRAWAETTRRGWRGTRRGWTR
jgi:cobalamin biosynthetic protein CobC